MTLSSRDTLHINLQQLVADISQQQSTSSMQAGEFEQVHDTLENVTLVHTILLAENTLLRETQIALEMTSELYKT